MHCTYLPEGKKTSESIREPVLAVAPLRGAEPRARRAAHVVPPGGQGRQPRRRPGQEQEAAASALGIPLATPEETFCGGTVWTRLMRSPLMQILSANLTTKENNEFT